MLSERPTELKLHQLALMPWADLLARGVIKARYVYAASSNLNLPELPDLEITKITRELGGYSVNGLLHTGIFTGLESVRIEWVGNV